MISHYPSAKKTQVNFKQAIINQFNDQKDQILNHFFF